MRTTMFSIEQANDDTEKPGYFGHTVRIGLFRASEQLPPLGAPETHSYIPAPRSETHAMSINGGQPSRWMATASVLVVVSAALFGLAQGPARPGGSAVSTQSIPIQGDEFVGPFSSWTNVKTAYGAAANGMADDTLAIQRGLDELGKPDHSPVLFLPSGIYRITKTLVLASNINVSIVGEDPATTTIVWDGEASGTMMWLNGIAYSRFVRLTFDGKRRASVAVEQSWDMRQPHFDTGNEYSDDGFVDVEYGIHGGFKGGGFAETSIRRSRFLRNTKAGVALGNFNALDIWIWDSLFEDCDTGVTNTSGAGNFHVYRSAFRRSARSDLSMRNTGGAAARGYYSAGP